jgi:SAM-dependent methyltransferase
MNKIEEISAYWDKSPCNVKHGEAPVGSSLWSHQVTTRKYWVEQHIPPFAGFSDWKGKRVLELGCGIGTDTIQFAKYAEHVDAVDISKVSLELAMKRAALNNYSNIGFYEGNIEDPLPFTANEWNTYDLVYSFGVLHHTPHPEAVLQNAHKFLKPDGELRIMLYAKWSYKYLVGQQPEAQAGCPLVRWYTVAAARRLVETCKFRVLSIQKTHIFPWNISEYKQHRYVREFPWNFVSEHWLEPYLGHHILLVARKA